MIDFLAYRRSVLNGQRLLSDFPQQIDTILRIQMESLDTLSSSDTSGTLYIRASDHISSVVSPVGV